MYLINGELAENLPANDRAVQFGDGCFTTARVCNGSIRFLEQHLGRLQQACDKLLIPFVDWSLLANEMQQMAAAEQQAVLKVMITRGSGCLLYTSPSPRDRTRSRMPSSA